MQGVLCDLEREPRQKKSSKWHQAWSFELVWELSNALKNADIEGNLGASVLVTCIRVDELSFAHEQRMDALKKSEATSTRPLL